MNPEITYRLALTFGLLGLGAAVFYLLNRILLSRAQNNTGQKIDLSGKPVLLYFTTPTCAPCKTIQRPAIHRLHEMLGERIKIIEIDAAAHPAMASRWGVLSVPTTFIIDPQGRPRHVNHGIASAAKLERQLNDLL